MAQMKISAINPFGTKTGPWRLAASMTLALLNPIVKAILATAMVAPILVGCGGGGGSGVHRGTHIPGPTYNDLEPETIRISTSFTATKSDHYPLDAHAEETAGGFNIRMVERESEIASREYVYSFLREQIFDYEFDIPMALHNSPPVIRFYPDEKTGRAETIRAVDNINAWLPWDLHIRVGKDLPGTIEDYGFPVYSESGNDIRIHLQKESHEANYEYGGISWPDAISIAKCCTGDVRVIQHELLHAMGLGVASRTCAENPDLTCASEQSDYYEHVPVIKFPESEMAYASPYDPKDGLSQIDGEIIQALYTKLIHHGQTPINHHYIPEMRGLTGLHPESFDIGDLGPWDETVTRYMGMFSPDIPLIGVTDEVKPQFGVDWRNGMARPWADGNAAHGSFAQSGLYGSATWEGEMVGFTPGREAVRGNSRMEVNTTALTGNAAFTDLEHWGAGEAPGVHGTGLQWNDGDLRYSFDIENNHFRSRTSNDGDEGYISGRFVGAAHEGVIGILERPDLTAAFGAGRDE